MNLGEITAWFVKVSGRYDLVKQDGSTDNGAYFYINAGQRLLDILQDNIKTRAWHYGPLVVGDDLVLIQNFRSIEDLWIVSSETRYPLIEKDLKWILENYTDFSGSRTACIEETNLTDVGFVSLPQPTGNQRLEFTIFDYTASIVAGTITIFGKDFNDINQTEVINCSQGAGVYKSSIIWSELTAITTASFSSLGGSGDEKFKVDWIGTTSDSRPLYYARVPIGLGGNLKGSSTRTFAALSSWKNLYFTGGLFQGDDTYEGILIVPAANEEYTVQAVVRFYTNEMTLSTDSTYWTEQWAYLSVLAALARLEQFYRNTEGYNDFVRQINLELGGVDQDLAMDEDSIAGQMESSWGD